jgi:hypothetical protein
VNGLQYCSVAAEGEEEERRQEGRTAIAEEGLEAMRMWAWYSDNGSGDDDGSWQWERCCADA